LHISWHGTERIIVLSVWQEDRCTASFRMPVRDARRLIAAVADAMSNAISAPGREIERTQLPRWRSTIQRLRALLPRRIRSEPGLPAGAGLRLMRIVDQSTPAHRVAEPAGRPLGEKVSDS
jgi:hypothetical protein